MKTPDFQETLGLRSECVVRRYNPFPTYPPFGQETIVHGIRIGKFLEKLCFFSWKNLAVRKRLKCGGVLCSSLADKAVEATEPLKVEEVNGCYFVSAFLKGGRGSMGGKIKARSPACKDTIY